MAIENKVIIIMGASSGIGEATAKLLAKRGAKLILAARRLDRLEAIKEEFPEVLIQQADVTDYASVSKVAKLAFDTYGKIDVLYNNAGIMPTAPLVEGRRGEWQEMLNINIMGVLNGIAAVLPIMEKQKSGHIISTDSVAGHVVYPDSAVYCDDAKKETQEIQVKITVGDTVLTATMLDNETSRDFITMLPLTLTLKDYAGTEKISDLPKRLSTEGAPSGYDPSVGTIAYYAPWGNLAIYYEDFGYSSGLVPLGHIESGIEKLKTFNRDFTATIERMD